MDEWEIKYSNSNTFYTSPHPLSAPVEASISQNKK
jgi:hypothetical protein